MMHFANPTFILIALLYGVFFVRYRQFVAQSVVRRRSWKPLAVHASACLLLILAAMGPQLAALSRHVQLIVAADVSNSVSVFYLPTQNNRIAELLGVLDRKHTDVGVVVFGGTAATERPLLPLPEVTDASTRSSARSRPGSPGAKRDVLPPLPSLEKEKRTSVIDTESTDIGNAIGVSRNLFPDPDKSRAILLFSDFRDTQGHAAAAAAALSGSGIDLLCTPVIVGTPADAHIRSIHVPDTAQIGRAIPVEVTVSALTPGPVRVELWSRGLGQKVKHYHSEKVELTRESGPSGGELQKTIRFIDVPDIIGVSMYAARIGSEQATPAGDVNSMDTLSAAVRVTGPSRWAVLAAKNSTLSHLAAANGLGVQTDVFEPGRFKTRGSDYSAYSGIIVDGLAAKDLPDPALAAISDALDAGKGLIAVGGENAFGAGGHLTDGKWESLLPIAMTPEDDRTRSVLFLIDISSSMSEKMGEGEKFDFAAKQLSMAAQHLKPLDRVGLITFSDTADYLVELNTDPERAKFRDALTRIKRVNSTDLLAPIKKAQEVLDKDDAEEQLVVLLSDGQVTSGTTDAQTIAGARALCPEPAQPLEPGATRRRTIFTFGIGTNPAENAKGDALMRDIAAAGGGKFSEQFDRLAERLQQAFDSQKKDFFKRRERFGVRSALDHPLLANIGKEWTPLPFRNRVKAKPAAETLLLSAPLQEATQKGARRPDPLLVLSGSAWPGTARVAALALSYDGADGDVLLKTPAGQKLLPALMEWAEARNEPMPPGWSLSTRVAADGALDVEVRSIDPGTHAPVNGLAPRAQLSVVESEKAPLEAPLIPTAPGVYRATFSSPTAGHVHSLNVSEGTTRFPERFVTIPFSAETTQLGVDRTAMQELVQKAGGGSRVIDRPQHLRDWEESKALAQSSAPLAPWLLGLALALLLGLYVVRGAR